MDTAGDTTGKTAKALRILAVEDHPDTRLLLGHLLGEGYEVTAVPGAEEALGALGSSTFDLLLIDVNLGGGKSGVELLRQVSAKEDIGDLPAIAVTAYAMPGDRDDLLSEGFDGYVSKPFARQDLIETIEQVL